jgi:hypothetical protein
MQLDEEIVEGLLCIFEMTPTSNYLKLNLKLKTSFVLRDKLIRSINYNVPTEHPIQICLDGKQSEIEADHSIRTSAGVKNEWSYKPTPHICHQGVHTDCCNFPHLL